jgi:hypothetical protein
VISQRRRGLSRPVAIAAIAILLQLVTQLVVVLPAHANSPPDCRKEIDGARWTDEWGYTYQCKLKNGLWIWEMVPFPDNSVDNSLFTTGNPTSYSFVSAGLRNGGRAEGAVQLFDGQGDPMSRPIKQQLVLSHYNGTSWVACRDSGWVNVSSAQFSHQGTNFGTSPPACGYGWYGAKTRSQYYSSAVGWLGGTWVLSGNIYFSSCCAPTTPPPPPPPMPTDP